MTRDEAISKLEVPHPAPVTLTEHECAELAALLRGPSDEEIELRAIDEAGDGYAGAPWDTYGAGARWAREWQPGGGQ